MPAKTCTNLFIAIFTVVIMAENCHKISAIQHEIEWNITTDFYAWSRSKTFYVGDFILFRYNQGLHSVVEVNGEDEFAECDTKNAVRSWKAGKDIIEISREGAFYFICGMPGYCYEGMKIKVVGVPQPPRSVPSTQTCLTTSWILNLALLLFVNSLICCSMSFHNVMSSNSLFFGKDYSK